MSAPSGAASGKWNSLVNGIVSLASQQTPPLTNATSSDVDTWLNAMWVNPAAENDRPDLQSICVTWLQQNQPDAPTLPMALHQFCTA